MRRRRSSHGLSFVGRINVRRPARRRVCLRARFADRRRRGGDLDFHFRTLLIARPRRGLGVQQLLLM